MAYNCLYHYPSINVGRILKCVIASILNLMVLVQRCIPTNSALPSRSDHRCCSDTALLSATNSATAFDRKQRYLLLHPRHISGNSLTGYAVPFALLHMPPLGPRISHSFHITTPQVLHILKVQEAHSHNVRYSRIGTSKPSESVDLRKRTPRAFVSHHQITTPSILLISACNIPQVASLSEPTKNRLRYHDFQFIGLTQYRPVMLGKVGLSNSILLWFYYGNPGQPERGEPMPLCRSYGDVLTEEGTDGDVLPFVCTGNKAVWAGEAWELGGGAEEDWSELCVARFPLVPCGCTPRRFA